MQARNFGIILILLGLVVLFGHRDLAVNGWLSYSPLLPVSGGILYLLDYRETKEKASLCRGVILTVLGGLLVFFLNH